MNLQEHLGDLPFPCNLCEQTFTKQMNLLLHRRLAHKDYLTMELANNIRDEIRFPCIVCHIIFQRKDLLWSHMHQKHPHFWTSLPPGGVDTDSLQFTAENFSDSEDDLNDVESYYIDVKEELFTEYSGAFTEDDVRNIHYQLKKEESTNHSVEESSNSSNSLGEVNIKEEDDDEHISDAIMASQTMPMELNTSFDAKMQKESVSCELCGMNFTSAKFLSNHKRFHDLSRRYPCDICSLRFIKLSHLTRHKEGVHREKATYIGHKQSKESTPGVSAQDRSQEVKEKVEEGVEDKQPTNVSATFLCDLCDKSFIKESALFSHKRLHDPTRPFSCDVCAYRFIKESHLIKHKGRIHQTKKRTMATSSKKIKVKNRESGGTETKPGVVICVVCKKTFSRKDSLKRHIKVHFEENNLSGGKSHDRYTDNSIKKPQTSERVGTAHAVATDSINTDSIQYSCNLPDPVFEEKTRVKKLRIDVLNILSKSSEAFRRKIKEKLREAKMNERQELRNEEIRNEKGEVEKEEEEDWLPTKPRKRSTLCCSVCKLTFKKKSHLKRHKERIHARGQYGKPWPYSCETCGTAFTLRENLVRHKRNVHGEERSVEQSKDRDIHGLSVSEVIKMRNEDLM